MKLLWRLYVEVMFAIAYVLLALECELRQPLFVFRDEMVTFRRLKIEALKKKAWTK